MITETNGKKRIAILGCENSHADGFLKILRDCPGYDDVEVFGVYSEKPEAAAKLSDTYGVAVLPTPEAAASDVDGVVITARHGNRHLPFALPYFAKKPVMFIDKPITVSEEDARTLAALLSENGIRFTGGSMLRYEPNVCRLAAKVREEKPTVFGGFVRCPIRLENPYGDFYFYAQHLVEIVCEIYGRDVRAVRAAKNGRVVTVIFRYDHYDVVGEYVDGDYLYSVLLSTANQVENVLLTVDDACCRAEFDEFCALLRGGACETALSDFFAPVFIMNATARSLESGAEEAVGRL